MLMPGLSWLSVMHSSPLTPFDHPTLFTHLRGRGQPVEKGLAEPRGHLLPCLRVPWNSRRLASGRRRAAACDGLFWRLVPKARSRFTFWPAAVIRASVFTFSSRLSLNLPAPCHPLASAKSGSTHTARLRRALR